MSMNAIALLRWKPEATHVTEPDGATPLDGRARRVPLQRGFEAFAGEPDDGAYQLRQCMGAALDAHDDAHGVFVYPDVARPEATTYDGVISEVGELGVWVRVVAADFKPAPRAAVVAGPASDASANAAKGPGAADSTPSQADVMAQLQSMMAGGNLGDLAANPEMLAKLSEMGRGLGLDPNMAAAFGMRGDAHGDVHDDGDDDVEMDPAALMASMGIDASQLPPEALEAMMRLSEQGGDLPMDLSQMPPEVLAGAQQMAMQLLQGGGLDLQKLAAMMGGAPGLAGLGDFGDASDEHDHDDDHDPDKADRTPGDSPVGSPTSPKRSSDR